MITTAVGRIALGTLAIVLSSAPLPLRAQDTGLAGMHSWVRIGGRVCMADHFHDGSGSGPTRAHAQRAAVRAWQDFTAWEYGGRWGSFGNAVSRSTRCSGARGDVSCSVSARPCRH
jgi:hypothetical protein